MKSEQKIDPYLKELIHSKSSSQLKLIAAWDGLSIETQIKILYTVNHGIPDEIIEKGLNSPNDYVRYLIADRFFYPFNETDADKELLKIISTDKSPIVKFTKFPSQKIHVREKNESGRDVLVLKPEKFFDMAQEEQYLYFSNLSVSHGEEISQILKWGFDTGIDHRHICNLIVELEHEFFKHQSDKHITDDGCWEYSYARGLEALWRLVPSFGDTVPARYLILSLPLSGALFRREIIEDVIKLLPETLVSHLLMRKNPHMSDLRKKILKETAFKTRTSCRIEKLEEMKFFALIGLFIFGIIMYILDIKSWFVYICIGIPVSSWLDKSIKQFFNSKIDEIVDKVDKRIRKRLKTIN